VTQKLNWTGSRGAQALDGHMGLRGLSYRPRLTPYAAGGTNVGWFILLVVIVALIAAAIAGSASH
jgi:hypothetical protein